MAKEISGYVKLQVKGGQANPAPPVGPALGSKGVNIMEFCKQFNARTQDKQGKVVPVLITVYTDKSFDFVIKTAPAPVQLMEAAKIQKGSKESNRDKVGKVTWAQVEVIAKEKQQLTKERSGEIESVHVYKINKNSTDAELNKIKENLKKDHNIDFEISDVKRNSDNALTSIKIDIKIKNLVKI